jgi:RNA polymerase sigma-70 factor (ECF subfamily)
MAADGERLDEFAPAKQAQFATTHWSVVLAAGQDSSPTASEALDRLCRTYWYPLYAFVRRSGRDAPEAEDLTQEFFARLLQKDFPAGIKPEGGKFRSYLLASLKNFLVNEWASRQTAKRGGGKSNLSLEDLGAEARYQSEPADQATPDRLFERRWASALLDQVRQGLKDEYAAEGKDRLFESLRPSLTEDAQLIPYDALGRQLGMSEGAIKTAIYRLRKRYGELLRFEIAQTVDRPEDIEDEIRCLITGAGYM